jgi:hypothetical protein
MYSAQFNRYTRATYSANTPLDSVVLQKSCSFFAKKLFFFCLVKSSSMMGLLVLSVVRGGCEYTAHYSTIGPKAEQAKREFYTCVKPTDCVSEVRIFH